VAPPRLGEGVVTRLRRIPWRRLREPDPDHRYTLSVGVFVLDRSRYIPKFVLRSIPVRRIVRRAEGLVGYTLMARFRERTFIEMVAFESPDALRRFVAQPGHVAAMEGLRPHIGRGSKIVSTEVYGRDLPPDPAFVAAELEAIPGFEDVPEPPGNPSGAGPDHAPGAHARPVGADGALLH
jgi:hypothetical protein